MTNTQFLEKFNNLIDVIEHYGGTIGVHKEITEDILAQHTGGIYNSVNWKLANKDEQMKQANQKGKGRFLARMFFNRVDRARYGSMLASCTMIMLPDNVTYSPMTEFQLLLSSITGILVTKNHIKIQITTKHLLLKMD
jgi:hypothetical protein